MVKHFMQPDWHMPNGETQQTSSQAGPPEHCQGTLNFIQSEPARMWHNEEHVCFSVYYFDHVLGINIW